MRHRERIPTTSLYPPVRKTTRGGKEVRACVQWIEVRPPAGVEMRTGRRMRRHRTGTRPCGRYAILLQIAAESIAHTEKTHRAKPALPVRTEMPAPSSGVFH